MGSCELGTVDENQISYKPQYLRVKELNVRAKTIKPLEENIGEKLHDIGFGSHLLHMTPKTQITKEKNGATSKSKTTE